MDDYEFDDDFTIEKSSIEWKKIALIVLIVVVIIAGTLIVRRITYKDVKGEVMKTDTISALCPEGWNLVGQNEQDFSFAKGGNSTYEYPHIGVTHNRENIYVKTQKYNYENRIEKYGNLKNYIDIPPFKINGRVWKGCSYDQYDIQYTLLMLDNYKVSAIIVNKDSFKGKISYTDHDFKAILASIKVE